MCIHMEQDSTKDFKLSYNIIARDKKIEKKCTLYPLRGRKDFSFRTKKDPRVISSDSVLLFPNWEPLTLELAENIKDQVTNNENVLEIVLVDSRWKKAKGIADSLPPMRKVSLEGYETGAQRKDPPPKGGLASCEALYLASLFFGKADLTLLDNYHFKNRFFNLNGLDSHKL